MWTNTFGQIALQTNENDLRNGIQNDFISHINLHLVT